MDFYKNFWLDYREDRILEQQITQAVGNEYTPLTPEQALELFDVLTIEETIREAIRNDNTLTLEQVTNLFLPEPLTIEQIKQLHERPFNG